MLTPSEIKQQIDRLVLYLVEAGLSSDQQFCFQRPKAKNVIEITFPGSEHVSVALKDTHYTAVYDHLARERAYNFKMMDGAMVQMMYVFNGPNLQRQRLAFLPSPHLEEFQSSPEIYLEDEIYADIISKSVVPFPVRFDYDSREEHYKELEHPKSHLSLGQYENCRIPVSSPLTPFHFVQFILRNFYHTAHQKYADKLPTFNHSFAETIEATERCVIHVQVPYEDGSKHL
jgi:hypothetical protein